MSQTVTRPSESLLRRPGGVPLRAEIIEQVLVKVNGDIITRRSSSSVSSPSCQPRPELAKLPPNSPQLRRRSRDRPDADPGRRRRAAAAAAGHEHGWALTDEQFKDILGNIRRTTTSRTTAAFKKALEAGRDDDADLRKSIERDMLIRQVTQRRSRPRRSASPTRKSSAYYDATRRGVHLAVRGHAARDPDCGADHRSRRQRGAGRCGAGEGGGRS